VLVYRCRDCELDPTCAVCVSCFLAGNHKDHDYQMIRTGGGCCDCGDPSAWRREGFCPNHRGPSEAPELPGEFVQTARPVLNALLSEWAVRLEAAHRAPENESILEEWRMRTANEMSSAVSRELLDLANRGEALLRFVAGRVGAEGAGLLDALLRCEQALWTEAQTEVHALLYKLLGDPDFKYSFAKVRGRWCSLEGR
jgi:hypothetical protein